MSNVSDFLGGGGGGWAPPVIRGVFYKSGVFVAKKNGEIRISGLGPGGSGGVVRQNSTLFPKAVGGAAGGFLPPTIFKVKKGDTFVVTIGAPGAGVSITAGMSSSGNAGGNTTIVGPGVSITIEGGKGGSASALAANPALPGADGGKVIGAIGNEGGKSGSVSGSTQATGGGAPDLFGIGFANTSSGSCTISSNSGATGGASCGGKSYDSLSLNSYTHGAGSGGDSNSSGPGPDLFGRVLPVGSTEAKDPEIVGVIDKSWIYAIGPGGWNSSTLSAPTVLSSGGGSGSALSGSVPCESGASGAFAGSGAALHTSSGSAKSGDAGFGAGSGAAVCLVMSGSSTVTSGKGGASFVIIEEM